MHSQKACRGFFSLRREVRQVHLRDWCQMEVQLIVMVFDGGSMLARRDGRKNAAEEIVVKGR